MNLKNDLNLITVKKQLEEKAIKEQYALQLRDRDGEIERLRDMKARLSTKMVGETLEQHCEIEFNRIRATAFQRRILRRTTTPAPAARATTSFATQTSTAPRSFPSCLR
jgi:hypothetical protein